MKLFKTITLAALITCSVALNANTTEPTNPISKVTSKEVKASMNLELGELLKDANLELSETIQAKVSFTVNKNNEVVVLSVEATNASVEKFIQNRLNYQKLQAKAIKGQTYYLPVTLEGTL